jgi:hypothetical protein
MSLPVLNVPYYELILPSNGKKIKYRPYLVKEQKILLMAVISEDLKDMTSAVKQIIENCTYNTVDVSTLPQFDIEYIFLKIRSKSVGEICEPTTECPSCKKPIKLRIDLNTIEVSKPKQSNKIELAKNVGIIFKYPTLEEEIKIQTSSSTLPSEYELLYSCIEKMYDENQVYTKKDFTVQEFAEFIENLNSSQFEKILDFFANQPKVETTVDINCVCGYNSTITLQGLPDFLG